MFSSNASNNPIGSIDPVLGSEFNPIGGFGWMLLRTSIILVVVCLLAYLLIRVLQRLLPGAGSASGQGRLVLLERLALEPRRSLQVVRAGSKVLLLAVADGQVSLIAQLDPEDWGTSEVNDKQGGQRFKEVLSRVIAKPRSEAESSPSQTDVIQLRFDIGESEDAEHRLELRESTTTLPDEDQPSRPYDEEDAGEREPGRLR